MATDTHLTATGNLTADPTLRFTTAGTPVASFTVACNDRRKNAAGQWEDAGTLWVRCAAWGRLAEAAAEQLAKGDAVTVTGHLRPDDYERDGTRHSGFQVQLGSLARLIRPTSAHRGASGGAAAPGWTSDAPDASTARQAALRPAVRPPF